MGRARRLFMGLGRTTWYGYYGYYFNPYPAYATAALWMTDYVISQNLQNAYAAQAEANANANAAASQDDSGNQDASAQGGGNGGGVVLTPEVKQAIADEVKAQLASEQQAASAPAPAAAPAAQNTASDANPPEETLPRLILLTARSS